jgi:mannonate dehydratase
MVMPDHVPRHPDDDGRFQGFAFAYGYIKAVLQALGTLG